MFLPVTLIVAAMSVLSPAGTAGQVSSAAPAAASATSAATVGDAAVILVIDDIDLTRPIFLQAIEHIREAISEQVPRRSIVRVESLGLHYPSAERHSDRLVGRILEDYSAESIDLLVATGDSSVTVAMRVREMWGRDIPIVGLFSGQDRLSPTAPLPPLPNGVQVRLAELNSVTARNMQALLPSLSEVLIVGPNVASVEAAAGAMRPVLGEAVRVDVIVSPSLEELKDRFDQLSEQAAILYLSVGVDSQGNVWQIRDYLRRLVEIAPRPVFGWLGGYMGLGIVGGPLIDGSEIGIELGRLAAEVLNGADPSALGPGVIDNVRVVYDWVPLKRFNIPLRHLPANATLLNRPLPIWESYPRTSITAGALIAFLLTSLGILMHSRRRIREANAARVALSHRLLQAQDEERVRIARDLHDDLCQEMAILSIEMARPPETPNVPNAWVDRMNTLIDRTRKIAVGLHGSHIGSMPFRDALESHVMSLGARSGLEIQFQTTAWGAEPEPSVAIALYRCTQEALQNVIRHAEATEVTILLESSEGRVRIEITDDGIGFEPSEAGTKGLGMTSMRERLAAIGGSFHVRSVPFEGTTIVLSVPTQGAKP